MVCFGSDNYCEGKWVPIRFRLWWKGNKANPQDEFKEVNTYLHALDFVDYAICNKIEVHTFWKSINKCS